MANRIYFAIRWNILDERFELHVSKDREDVEKWNALSKSIPENHPNRKETWQEIVNGWRSDMKDLYDAIEVLG